jgi:hypothetical protein
MTDGAVFPLTPNEIIEVSDTDNNKIAVTESSDDGDDKILDFDDNPPGKTSTQSDYRMILYCDVTATPINQAVQIAATNIRQNLNVVSDVEVMIPYHLCDMELDKEPAASDSGIANITGAMVPGPSGDGSSSNRSLHFSPAVGQHQPSNMVTARGSLLNSYLICENAQGCAYLALVVTVAQQMDGQVSYFIFCRTFVETWIVDLELSPNI